MYTRTWLRDTPVQFSNKLYFSCPISSALTPQLFSAAHRAPQKKISFYNL